MTKPTRTVRLVLESDDLNEIVRNKYGGHYDVASSEGIVDPSNICLEYANVVDDCDDLDYYEDEVTEFRLSGNPNGLTTYHVLCVLCADRVIPAGDYLIRIV